MWPNARFQIPHCRHFGGSASQCKNSVCSRGRFVESGQAPFGGPDELDNGLALCSLHHKLLDRGVIGFADPETIVVSETYTARSPEGRRIYDLHRRLFRPRPGTPLPKEVHVAWQTSEAFKSDPLSPQDFFGTSSRNRLLVTVSSCHQKRAQVSLEIGSGDLLNLRY
jgi:hypothetical protein